MTPVPQTKTNDILKELDMLFNDDQLLNDVQAFKYKKEIAALKKVDPDVAFYLEALFCAIQGDEDKAVFLAQTTMEFATDDVVMHNCHVLLCELGESFLTHKILTELVKKHPTSRKLLDDLITSSEIMEDAETLDASLNQYHQLFNKPAKAEIIFAMTQQLAMLSEDAENNISELKLNLEKLTQAKKNDNLVQLSNRNQRRIAAFMSEMEE